MALCACGKRCPCCAGCHFLHYVQSQQDGEVSCHGLWHNSVHAVWLKEHLPSNPRPPWRRVWSNHSSESLQSMTDLTLSRHHKNACLQKLVAYFWPALYTRLIAYPQLMTCQCQEEHESNKIPGDAAQLKPHSAIGHAQFSYNLLSFCKKVYTSEQDGYFTFSEMECMGACANAPMICVADYTQGVDGFTYIYYEDLSPKDAVTILEDLKAGKTPKVRTSCSKTYII